MRRPSEIGIVAKLIMTAVMIAAWTASLAAAGQVGPEQERELRFKVGGLNAGSETFSIERYGEGFVMKGDVSIEVPGLALHQQPTVRTDGEFHPIEATIKASVNGEETEVKSTFKDGRFVMTVKEGEEPGETEEAYNEECFFLANNVIHHMIPFILSYDVNKAGSQIFCAIPEVPVKIELRGRGTTLCKGRPLDYNYFFVNIANVSGSQVFATPEGRLLKLYSQLQGFEAVDSEYLEIADSLFAPGKGTAPTPPEGLREMDVRFQSGDIELAGTLSLPDRPGPHPGVVLVSGSGPQDRDENTSGTGGLDLHIFRKIAYALGLEGIAVLRYDDRGVAQSGGTYEGSTLEDFTGDARSAVAALRDHPSVDPERVAIVGHSEGAIIAPIVAADDPGLAAIVLMAGPAKSIHEILRDQQTYVAESARLSEDARDKMLEQLELFIGFVLSDQEWDEDKVPAEYRKLEASREWFRQHFEHDPLAQIRKVTCPVLILQGGRDFQVPPENAHILGTALEEEGCKDYEVKVFSDLNHLFVVSTGEGMAEYSDTETELDERFLAHLTRWLRDHLK